MSCKPAPACQSYSASKVDFLATDLAGSVKSNKGIVEAILAAAAEPSMRKAGNTFRVTGALCDTKNDAADGCRWRYINSWGLNCNQLVLWYLNEVLVSQWVIDTCM